MCLALIVQTPLAERLSWAVTFRLFFMRVKRFLGAPGCHSEGRETGSPLCSKRERLGR